MFGTCPTNPNLVYTKAKVRYFHGAQRRKKGFFHFRLFFLLYQDIEGGGGNVSP